VGFFVVQEDTMPLTAHFGGHGKEVMSSMEKTYGPKKAKEVFYATENKRKAKDKKPSPYAAIFAKK
jgi:hypothetical protein